MNNPVNFLDTYLNMGAYSAPKQKILSNLKNSQVFLNIVMDMEIKM